MFREQYLTRRALQGQIYLDYAAGGCSGIAGDGDVTRSCEYLAELQINQCTSRHRYASLLLRSVCQWTRDRWRQELGHFISGSSKIDGRGYSGFQGYYCSPGVLR